jgi:hypothetical protein
MTTKWTMTIDCADPALMARFWCTALGYTESDPPKGWDSWEAFLTDQNVPADEWNDGAAISDPNGVLPALSFLKVPEPRTVKKNRLHLDLQVSGGRAEPQPLREQRIRTVAERLLTAGAIIRHEIPKDGTTDLDHLWMSDPEGNDFCVV